MAYNKLGNIASLFMYLSGNLELLERVRNNSIHTEQLVIFDRSLISSFSMYLSRKPESEWSDIIPIFKEAMSFMPEIAVIFYLKTSEGERKRRIGLKLGEEQAADLHELEHEAKKDRARSFLLSHTNILTVEIDTSNLSVQEAFSKVNSVIELVWKK